MLACGLQILGICYTVKILARQLSLQSSDRKHILHPPAPDSLIFKNFNSLHSWLDGVGPI